MGKSRTSKDEKLHRKIIAFARKHSLTIVLVIILAAQLIAYWYQGLIDWKSDQQAHGQPVVIWPDYVNHYFSEVWLSSLADTYGALIIVFLTKYFHEQRSAESKK